MKVQGNHNPYGEQLATGETVTVKGFSAVFRMHRFFQGTDPAAVAVPRGLDFTLQGRSGINIRATSFGPEFIGRWEDVLTVLNDNFDSFKRGETFTIRKPQPNAAIPG